MMTIPNLSDRINKNGAGSRNKNPGNRTGADSHFGSGVETGSSHKWTTYKDWTHGYAGNCWLLLEYLDGSKTSRFGLGERNPCMISVIYTWCPPGDGNNNSAGYVADMCKKCGIEPDDRIPITENNLIALELAKGCHDSGCVDNDACRKGVALAIKEYQNSGGKLDSDSVTLGKVSSDKIEKYKAGVAEAMASSGGGFNQGGSNGGSSLGVDGALYTNGNGSFSGSAWGTPIEGGEISPADNNVLKLKGSDGVVIGTHLRQK